MGLWHFQWVCHCLEGDNDSWGGRSQRKWTWDKSCLASLTSSHHLLCVYLTSNLLGSSPTIPEAIKQWRQWRPGNEASGLIGWIAAVLLEEHSTLWWCLNVDHVLLGDLWTVFYHSDCSSPSSSIKFLCCNWCDWYLRSWLHSTRCVAT